ncbi:MAG: AraC family transcriptional regulator [Myxococcota bacterium]
MESARQRINAAIEGIGLDRVVETSVANTIAVQYSRTTQMENRRWRACLAIVVRGQKDVVLGSTRHALTPGHFTLTPVPLAVTGRIAEAPFACLLIGLDPQRLGRVIAEMDTRDEPDVELGRGLFQGTLTSSMWAATARLAEAFSSPEEAAVLGPGRVRELLFYVLQGPCGPAIRGFVRAGSEAHRIGAAVHRIESQLNAPLDIAALAREASLSRTAFFAQFKRVTAHSPLQFQKRLRLLEAQRLMVDERTTAADAAFRVGFASASQFSREYARMFGESPSRHVARLRDQLRGLGVRVKPVSNQ